MNVSVIDPTSVTRNDDASTPPADGGAGWAGSPALAEHALVSAGVDPTARGEMLDVAAFARIAATRPA